MQTATTLPGNVTLRHPRDSRTSRVPTPTPTPTKTVQQRAALDLGEEPEKGARHLAEPAAARRRSARAARGVFSESDFRRLCVVMRREQDANQFETQEGLLLRVQRVAERAGLPCPPEAMTRLADVLTSVALRERARAEAQSKGWRERCASFGHWPRCRDVDACEQRIFSHAYGYRVSIEWVREARATRAAKARDAWRDRCAHTPRCPTPTQCALKDAKDR